MEKWGSKQEQTNKQHAQTRTHKPNEINISKK